MIDNRPGYVTPLFLLVQYALVDCTLSSAVCANLAKGIELETAVRNAKAYITGALAAGAEYTTGKGHGPVHHFYDIWPGT